MLVLVAQSCACSVLSQKRKRLFREKLKTVGWMCWRGQNVGFSAMRSVKGEFYSFPHFRLGGGAVAC